MFRRAVVERGGEDRRSGDEGGGATQVLVVSNLINSITGGLSWILLSKVGRDRC